MSSFKCFMNEVACSSVTVLPKSNTSLAIIETNLVSKVSGLLKLSVISDYERQKFSESVSSLVRDEEFLADFSSQIGVPSELETEDEFVARSSNIMQKMLYDRFG